MPGNVTYNGYYAMRELLRVIEEVGSTNNIQIIKAFEGRVMPTADRMQHHLIRRDWVLLRMITSRAPLPGRPVELTPPPTDRVGGASTYGVSGSTSST